NAAELRIDRVELTLQSGETLQGSVALDAQEERCRLSFGRGIPAGTHRLFLSFAGTLNDKLRGFYRSSYKTPSGGGTRDSGSRWLAATQFEATDARRAFPCWDEPS